MFSKRGVMQLALVMATAPALFVGHSAHAQQLPGVVATINGQPVTQDQLLGYVRANTPQSNLQDPAVRNQVLQSYVGRELMYQDAMRLKIDQQPAVQAAIEEARRVVIAQAYVSQLMEEAPVTEEMAREIYNQQVGARKGTEYHARHILVKSEEDAKGAIIRLKKGEDFGRVAQSVSTDSSAVRGGDLGWVMAEKYPVSFAEAMAALKPGKFTTTPVKTDFGWHIILVEANRPIQPPPFEGVRDQIMKGLRDQVVAKHMSELQKRSKIEFPR